MTHPRTYVLDASALLAPAHGERRADKVAPLVGSAALSSVNWEEVYRRAAARGVSGVALKGKSR